MSHLKPLWLSLLCFVLLVGCSTGSGKAGNEAGTAMTGNASSADQTYSKSLGDLRADFNREKGQVRLILLLSPT